MLCCWKTLTFPSKRILRELTELHTDRCVLELLIWDVFLFVFYTPWHLKIAFFGDSVARHCVLLILWFVYISAFNVRLGPKKHTSTAYYWLFIYIQRERERPVEPLKNMYYLKFKGISHSTNPAAKVWTSPSYLPSTGYTVNDSSNQAERFATFLNNWTEMGKKIGNYI